MEQRSWDCLSQSSNTFMGYDHAPAWINLSFPDYFSYVFPVEFEDSARIRSRFGPLRDRIFAPMRRASTEPSEADVIDCNHVRMDEVALLAKRCFVTQLAVPIAVHVKNGTFERRQNAEKLGGAVVADISGNDDGVERVFL